MPTVKPIALSDPGGEVSFRAAYATEPLRSRPRDAWAKPGSWPSPSMRRADCVQRVIQAGLVSGPGLMTVLAPTRMMRALPEEAPMPMAAQPLTHLPRPLRFAFWRWIRRRLLNAVVDPLQRGVQRPIKRLAAPWRAS